MSNSKIKNDLSIVPDPIPTVDSSLYYQVPNWAAKKAIAAKLTGADWCVWSYLQMLDPFGDRLMSCPVPEEIAKEVSLSEKQVKRSLNKLEEMGFWEFKVTTWKGRNLATPRKSRTKDKTVQSETELSESGQNCPSLDRFVQSETDLSAKRQSCPKQELELPSDKGFKIPQTYTDLSSENIQTISDRSPLTPQGEFENGGDEEIAVEVEVLEEEEATTPPLPIPQPQNTSSCQPESISSRINIPPADENHSQILPSDPMAEKMQTQREIVATGAMKGASHPDPDFLEFYRNILSKCTHYKGRTCNLNHAKAALKKLWNEEPLRIRAEAENWQESKTQPRKTTLSKDISELSSEERKARLLAARQQNQQSKGA